MKKLKYILLLAILYLPALTFAQESQEIQDTRSFMSLGLGGGGSFGINESVDRPITYAFRGDLLWIRGFGGWLSPELGLSYLSNKSKGTGGFSNYSIKVLSPDFHLRITPFGLDRWSLYAYGAIGAAIRNINDRPYNADPGTPNNGTDAAFGGGIGLFHRLGTNWALDLSIGGMGTSADNLNPVHDGQNDGWWQGILQFRYIFDDGSYLDDDQDGLSNEEERILGTDPKNPDTDGDGLKDGEEVHTYKTDPLKADTDGDGLKDGEEVHTYKTDPLNKDTDSDGLTDGDEVLKFKTSPTNPDTDGDGLKDGDELMTYRTDPLKADTDGDGLSDGDEVMKYKTNPVAPDTDGDLLSDGDEVNKYHTNPLDPDTDRGSVSDGIEVQRGTNPLDPSDDVPKKDEFDVEKIGAAIVLEGVVFDVNKSTVKPESEPILIKAFKTMEDHAAIEVEIRGHTDNTGKHDKNVKLSLDRAESVKAWLVNKGISANRITTKGFGPDSPVAPNDTPENKQKNRRIEFVRMK